jgi:DNA primase catalytic core
MSWYDLDEVLSKAEMPEVARRLGMNVERRGANLLTLCPFHQESRPSLVLYPSDGASPSHFHCFSCNAHGYAVDLVKQVQGSEFKTAVEWLAHSLGISPKRTVVARRDAKGTTGEGALIFAQRVFDRCHDEAGFVEWCNSRRFDRDFLYGFGLRCLPVGSVLVRALQSEDFGRQQELIDGLLIAGLLVRLRPEKKSNAQSSLSLSEQCRDYFHDGRVLIPIRSGKNDLIGFAGRHRPEAGTGSTADHAPAKYLLTPGFRKAEVLFNAYQAQAVLGTVPTLYVVEGFMDALRLQALNLPAVAVMGTSLSEEQRKGLVTLVGKANPSGVAHLSLRLFFDRDTAGFDGASRATRQLLGLHGVATEWIGFGDHDNSLVGKDPDGILSSLSRDDAIAMLDQHALPSVGVLIAASLGYKDATPLLSSARWSDISRYPRERALLQTARTVRALSGAAVDWAERLEALAEPRPQWIIDLLGLLGLRQRFGQQARSLTEFQLTFLVEQEARLNHARMLAEHGARRGELPCDEEYWRALDRNAQLFNTLALDRLKQPAWQQTAPCDAVHLPRKLSADDKVLSDPRRKVMPHAADLHLQQFLMYELLTERHDFSHEGPRSFSDCIPAVRWFGTEGEVLVTGNVEEGEPSPALLDDERGEHNEEVLSFAYQIDMDVLEGRRKPSDQGMFRPYIDCWRHFMSSLGRQARAIGPHVHVLRLDAKRYYDSIQRYVVRDRLLKPIEQDLNI